MNIAKKSRNILFLIFAILSFSAAAYHFTGIFYKINEAPVWRHILFVFINLFCIFGFIKRPRFFIYFFCAFIIQQYITHGQVLMELWEYEQEIHWISLGVLIITPLELMALIADYKSRKLILSRKS